ncbi:unnamed protein product [Schistocephalus solidus]|uniref:Armadillo repeat-containing protein 5 n=1 Tax=Schistocephalus solidus TaxID=70667 RepID=A0A183T7M3_SCHSO|nr:unnamed protein product [Schistocephalus solidus]
MSTEDANATAEEEIKYSFWERRLDEYVTKCLSGGLTRAHRQSGRAYRGIDEIRRAVESNFHRGNYTDAVSYDRMRATQGRPGSRLGERKKYANDLCNLTRYGTAKEMVVFATEISPSSSQDTETPDLDRDVATREFYERILLAKKSTVEQSTQLRELKKYFDYVRECNANGVIIALLNIHAHIDCNMDTIMALESSGGITVLLNLLGADVPRVQKAVIKVLLKLCKTIYFARLVVGLGGLPSLARLLSSNAEGVCYQAAEVLAQLAYLKETRTIAYRTHLISELVCLLGRLVSDVEHFYVLMKVPLGCGAQTETEQVLKLPAHMMKVVAATASVLKTISRLAMHPPNIELIRRAGAVPLTIKLLSCPEIEILVPAYQFLSICASEDVNRKTIIGGDSLATFLKASEHPNVMLRVNSTKVISICLLEESVREDFLRRNGSTTFFHAIKRESNVVRSIMSSSWLGEDPFDPRMHIAVTKAASAKDETHTTSGVIAPMDIEGSLEAQSGDVNAKHILLLSSLLDALTAFIEEKKYLENLAELGLTRELINLISLLAPHILNHYQVPCVISPKLLKLKKVECCATSALKCLSKFEQSPASLRMLDSEPTLIQTVTDLLTLWNSSVLESSIGVVAALTAHSGILDKLLNAHVFRVVLSLSQHPAMAIKVAALKAANRLLQQAPDKKAILRPVASSLHHLVRMLRDLAEQSQNTREKQTKARLEEVTRWGFSFIAEMEQVTLYRTVLTDLGVTRLLIGYLDQASTPESCLALVRALRYASEGLSKCSGVLTEKHLARLFSFLKPPHEELQRTAGHVIYTLDQQPVISRRMKDLGLSNLLIQMLGSGIRELQLAAATTICKMKLKFKKKKHPSPEYADGEEGEEEDEVEEESARLFQESDD